MRPLLWKEMRELRVWLLGGVALIVALELLVTTQVFYRGFVGFWMQALMPLSAFAVAIGLAVWQVARERHTRTLDFLRVRPVSPGTVVWSKFLAGSAVLALLLSGIVALAYADPKYTSDTGLQTIREQVSMGQMLATLLPRFWCLYAVSLLFSTLVDRSAKAAALAGVVVLTLIATAEKFTELAPFSGFVYWLPYFDRTFGLVEAAGNSRLSGMTGLVYAAVAILVTAAAAALLKRSPERYLGYPGLAVAVVGVVGAAVASAQLAANRLPLVAPAGVWEFQATGEWGSAGLWAEGGLVALSHQSNIRFLDFTAPSRPKQVADVTIPLWTSLSDWTTDRGAMQDGTVFLLGKKKGVPVDQVEIAIVKPAGLVDTISLGPVRPDEYASTPVPVGAFLYLAVTRERVGSLLVFDRKSHAQVATLFIDRMRPPLPGKEEGAPPVRMLRRGNFLYIASPSYLTAVDIASPDRPVVASRLSAHTVLSLLYGFPRPLASQDNRLFEIRIFPETLASYDLTDPAHPLAQAELTDHDSFGMTIGSSGHNLYQPWRSGLLEYRAAHDDLHARRYLSGDNTVTAIATSGDSVYALTAADTKDRRQVQAFR